MDPIITAPMLVSVLTKTLDSAAGEAGKRAWASLAAAVARHRGRSNHADTDGASLLTSPPGSPAVAAELAETLVRMAAVDPELAAELQTWHSQVSVMLTGAGDVANSVTGTVHGPLIQARDISGPITFN